MATGQIIFLNGASSAGETTIAHALQARLPTPYLHISIDNLLQMLPARFHERAFGNSEQSYH
jgi:chloramphenicol 3-O phosphotransferase